MAPLWNIYIAYSLFKLSQSKIITIYIDHHLRQQEYLWNQLPNISRRVGGIIPWSYITGENTIGTIKFATLQSNRPNREWSQPDKIIKNDCRWGIMCPKVILWEYLVFPNILIFIQKMLYPILRPKRSHILSQITIWFLIIYSSLWWFHILNEYPW